MNMWKQKHRMTHWMGRLFIVLSLVASWGAQATAMETVNAIYKFSWMGDSHTFIYSSSLEAAQAYVEYYHPANQPNPINRINNISCPPGYFFPVCTGDLYAYSSITHSMFYMYQISIQVQAELDCPTPTINPTVPYVYIGNHLCSRPSQQNLTIALSGGSEVEPSDDSTTNTLPFIATVIDQNTGQPTTNPVQVHISLKVDPTSGGHDHGDNTRPRGSVADVQSCDPFGDGICWSNPTANGAVVFNFNPTYASGTHTITATCDGCSNTATANVDVKIDGLWPIPDSGYYALTEDGNSKVIGSTTDHVYNHYLTTAASMKLWRLAADFYNYQIQNGVKTPILLHLNDASLKWGGIFDLDTDWDEPHAEHRRGIVIDVRANSNPGAIPATDYAAFKQMAKQLKVDPYFEGDSTGQHFHLRLLNKRG